jgi:hypothetical protein
MHTCKLRSTAQAAPQSTLIPGTDPARLKLTTCTCPRPTSPKLFKCTHDNGMDWGQAQERHTSTTIASGATRAPSARKRPIKGPLGHSGAARAPIVDSISSRFSAASRDACNQGNAMAVQVGRASTAPKQYLAGIYLKLHLMRCQRSREGLLEDLLFMLAGTPPIDGCRAGSWWHKQKGFIVQWRGARSSAL